MREVPRESVTEETPGLQLLSVHITDEDWLISMQLQDLEIGKIREILLKSPVTGEEKQIHQDYILKEGRIYRRVDGTGKWVVPRRPRERIIKQSHDDVGHLGLKNKLLLELTDGTVLREDTVRQIRKAAYELIKQDQLKQKLRYDAHRKQAPVYEVGNLVLVRREAAATGQSRKLTAKYKGPYLVAKVYEHDRYLLTDVPGAARTQRPFHQVYAADRIKRWCQLMDGDDDLGSEVDSDEGFRGFGSDEEQGFRGFDSNEEEGFRGFDSNELAGIEGNSFCQNGRAVTDVHPVQPCARAGEQ